MRRVLASIAVALAAVGGAPAAAAGAQSKGDELLSTPEEQANRAAGNELLSLVPSSYVARCLITPQEELPADPLLGPFGDRIQAFVYCTTPDGATVVHLIKVSDEATVNAIYDGYTPGGLAGQAGDCAEDGTWNDGKGRQKCYFGEGNVAVKAWTLTADGLVFLASRADGDVAALEAFWKSDSPPLSEPRAVADVVSDADWRTNGRLLRKSVPKAIRASCELPAISFEALGGLYRNRLRLRSALLCSPGAGVEGVQYASYDAPEPAQVYFDTFAALADEETPRAQSRNVECEGTGTWSRRGRTVGDEACYYSTGSRDSVAMVWVDGTQSVTAFAYRPDGDVPEMVRFFDDAGPLRNRALEKLTR